MPERQIIKSMKRLALIIFISLFIASCYYDVEEELYPNGCGTGSITFTSTIVPVLKNNCYDCHSSSNVQGGVILEGYANVKTYVSNGKLLSSIKHDGNSFAMPQGEPKLSDCLINKIETWINNGAPNN